MKVTRCDETSIQSRISNEVHNSKWRRNMFKIIGAAVVYGFAIYGLVTWLKSEKDDEEQVKAT